MGYYTGQENAAWPVLNKENAGLGQRQWAGGREEPMWASGMEVCTGLLEEQAKAMWVEQQH